LNNKNILIFCASLHKGGAERIVSLILKEFVKDKNLNIKLVLMEDGIDYEIPTSIKPTIFSKSNKSSIRKLLELPFVAWQLSQYIKENNIDVVMSFLYRPNYVNIIAKLLGAKHKSIINVVSTTSRYINEGIFGKINLFLIRSLFNKSDLIISNSHGVDEDLKSLMKITVNTKVVYNPIDLKYIENKKNICEDIDFEFKKDSKYIISVGRLIPLKRNMDLISAFATLEKNDLHLELIFLGDGALKKELIKSCEALNIDKKVHFLGNVKNPFYYLNKSNLFVLNSELEGLPNVLVEAMAVGLPVVSSDCKSGPREILVDEKYGLLYPVGDISILVDKMKIYLYSNIDNEEIKSKNLIRIKDFNIDKSMAQYKKALDIEE